MRKLIPLLAVALAFVSCLSSPTSLPPLDLGIYNPQNVSETELCTLTINSDIRIIKFDDIEVKWPKTNMTRLKTIKIPSGVHTFQADYNNGRVYTTTPMKITALLVKGKAYTFTCELTYISAVPDIIDNETKASVSIRLNIVKDPAAFAVTMDFIAKIITPGGEKLNKTVKMENTEYTLIFKPDIIFTLYIKKTNELLTGRRGFTVDLNSQTSKVYLLIADPNALSKDDFLKNNNYVENAQYVLAPVECTDTKVKFKVEKPTELAGTFWEFDIAVSTEGEQK